jgi:hypothetical protein
MPDSDDGGDRASSVAPSANQDSVLRNEAQDVPPTEAAIINHAGASRPRGKPSEPSTLRAIVTDASSGHFELTKTDTVDMPSHVDRRRKSRNAFDERDDNPAPKKRQRSTSVFNGVIKPPRTSETAREIADHEDLGDVDVDDVVRNDHIDPVWKGELFCRPFQTAIGTRPQTNSSNQQPPRSAENCSATPIHGNQSSQR